MSGMVNRSIGRRVGVSAVLVLACVAGMTAGVAWGQAKSAKEQVDEVLKGMDRGHGFGPVAISPDGAMLAFTHHAKDGWQVALAPFPGSSKLDTAKMTRVTAAKKAD